MATSLVFVCILAISGSCHGGPVESPGKAQDNGPLKAIQALLNDTLKGPAPKKNGVKPDLLPGLEVTNPQV